MAIWKRAATSVVDIPEPTGGHGWTICGLKVVVYLKFCQP